MNLPIVCLDCGTTACELYKVHDTLWNSVATPSDIVCIGCFEKRLGRGLTLLDIDFDFPWWQSERPSYYQGFIEGVLVNTTQPLNEPPEYCLGFELGQRLVTDELPDELFRMLSYFREMLFAKQTLGRSVLAQYVRERLPAEYLTTNEDLSWLDECSSFLKGEATNATVTQATHDALICNPNGHIDPFELLIDADICDTKCEPLREKGR